MRGAHVRVECMLTYDVAFVEVEMKRSYRMPKTAVNLYAQDNLFDTVTTCLSGCETLFRTLDIPAAQIDLMAFFEDYMRIAIRVQEDFSRIVKTREVFQQRSDVPHYLTHHLSSWIHSLEVLQPDMREGDELARARTLIRQGQRHNR